MSSIITIKFKKCTKCGLEKDESEFNKNKLKKDGLDLWCRKCRKDYNIKYNKEYNTRPYVKEHKKEAHEKWRNKSKEQIKELSKEYHKNNREKHLIRCYKRNDNNKNLICDLTEEWVKNNITNKSCIYCGETENIGCDRIDNTKGHTKNNVVPCCSDCNYTRLDIYSFVEMLKLGKTIKKIKQERKLNKDIY
jgi:hypothetical protein